MPAAWTFVQLSDIHIGSPDSQRFQPAWVANFETAVAQIKELDPQPDFIVVSGDLTRDGKTRPSELEAVKPKLAALPWPVHTIPGNHDIGNRYHPKKSGAAQPEYLERYRAILPDRFAFDHKGVRIAGFNSQLTGTGWEAEKEQWAWLEETASSPGASRQVWFTHFAPFKQSPDEPETSFEEDGWHLILGRAAMTRLAGVLKRGNVVALGTGHVHLYNDRSFGGVRYVGCPSTAFRLAPESVPGDNTRGFLEWRVTDGAVTPVRHLLREVSTLPGWGNDPGV
ncbi:MAG: metallophosphoesterase [Planctomycetes bacterium]|nr:metallophosphoesterase [Planctomycetota bacterium]